MKSFCNLSATASVVLLACMAMLLSPASAQSTIAVELTDNPRAFVQNLLDASAAQGMAPISGFVEKIGVKNPQMDATLSLIDSKVKKDGRSTVRIIDEVDSSGALRQVYAYTHYGDNAWFFWRFDFSATKDGWAVIKFVFNSEYEAIVAPSFPGAENIRTK